MRRSLAFRAGRGWRMVTIALVCGLGTVGCAAQQGGPPAATGEVRSTLEPIDAGRSEPPAPPSAIVAPTPAEVTGAFPLPDGARVLGTGADAAVRARWSLPMNGADAYAYYLAALPDGGYRIDELLPGGGVAVIRFRDSSDVAWALVLRGVDPLIAELRLDAASSVGGDGDP